MHLVQSNLTTTFFGQHANFCSFVDSILLACFVSLLFTTIFCITILPPSTTVWCSSLRPNPFVRISKLLATSPCDLDRALLSWIMPVMKTKDRLGCCCCCWPHGWFYDTIYDIHRDPLPGTTDHSNRNCHCCYHQWRHSHRRCFCRTVVLFEECDGIRWGFGVEATDSLLCDGAYLFFLAP